MDKILVDCWCCKGTGKGTCSRCHGTKKIPFGPDGRLYTCDKCYGSGKEQCKVCEGKGKYWTDQK